MADSPTKESDGKPADKPGVPIARVGKIVSDKNEAKARADAAEAKAAELQTELDKAKQAAPGLDLDKLIKAVTEVTQATVANAISSQVEPIQNKLSRAETALQLGLDPKQAEAVFALIEAHPTLQPTQAMRLARADHPELFGRQESRGFTPARHASLPPGGDSGIRTDGPPAEKDFMDNLRNSKTRQEAKFWAEKEFERRLMPYSPTAAETQKQR